MLKPVEIYGFMDTCESYVVMIHVGRSKYLNAYKKILPLVIFFVKQVISVLGELFENKIAVFAKKIKFYIGQQLLDER